MYASGTEERYPGLFVKELRSVGTGGEYNAVGVPSTEIVAILVPEEKSDETETWLPDEDKAWAIWTAEEVSDLG